MEYMKYDCRELAALSSELRDVHARFNRLSEEFSDTAGRLDPQLKSYENVDRRLAESSGALAELTSRFLALQISLDRITDIYRAADDEVMRNVVSASKLRVAEAPASAYITQNAAQAVSPILAAAGAAAPANPAPAPTAPFTVSTISGKDIIVEDWLAELMHRRRIVNQEADIK